MSCFSLWMIQECIERSIEINTEHFLVCPSCCRKLLIAYTFNEYPPYLDEGEKSKEIRELLTKFEAKFYRLYHDYHNAAAIILKDYHYSPYNIKTLHSRDVIINGMEVVKPLSLWEAIVKNGIPAIDFIHTDDKRIDHPKIKHFNREVWDIDFILTELACYIYDKRSDKYILLVMEKAVSVHDFYKTLQALYPAKSPG